VVLNVRGGRQLPLGPWAERGLDAATSESVLRFKLLKAEGFGFQAERGWALHSGQQYQFVFLSLEYL
jgi:hypothetical protein